MIEMQATILLLIAITIRDNTNQYLKEIFFSMLLFVFIQHLEVIQCKTFS